MPRSAAELSSAVRAADEMEIADKPCALAAAQKNDFAMMKFRQFCAMTDADNRRVFELLQ